ncbi:MAG TPA: 6-hydroxymethylpterin diphosphokinase MptE-like protein [Magnetospirillum sp.]|nr:6-hydroxymethylpterin diphosphokinase MptE-like protein [Magnetospirillum sp.]
MPEITLFDKNMAVFAREFPAVHEELAAIVEPLSSPVIRDGVAVDINLGNGVLYRGDGRELAREQVDAFFAAPGRIGYLKHEGVTGDSLVSRALFSELMDSLKRHGVGSLRREPVERSGFLIVFGVGLGHHLPLLVEKAQVRHVVLVEAVAEFLLASAHAIDWQELCDAAAAKGVTLHLILGRTGEGLAKKVDKVVETHGPALLDGGYLYRHYPFFALDEAYHRVVEEVPRQMIAMGYYEDERKMFRNAATNLHKTAFRLVEGEFRVVQNVPAFIIGSGPSLDECMEYIREWRDHAVVFSCGSSLQPCLKAGIVPDFHVELENITAVYDMLLHIGELHPEVFANGRFTKKLPLIASATVNPRVPPLFEDVYYFFRDTSSSTTSFGQNVKTMVGVGPNVSNTAIACAARLGFREMYLFGMDCGWRDSSNQHSHNTAYHTSEQFKNWKVSGEHKRPGNFGGEIETDMILDWSRDMMERKFRAFGCTVFNCSDGAAIRGAVPKLAEALDFSGRDFDRENLMEELRQGSPYFGPGDFLRDHDVARYVAEVDGYRAAIMALVDEAIDKQWGFWDFHDMVWPLYLAAPTSEYRHISVLFHCATIGMLKTAVFFLNRIEDEEARRKVTMDFFTCFRRLHEEFLTEGRQITEEIVTMVGGGPEPEWTSGLPMVPGTTY